LIDPTAPADHALAADRCVDSGSAAPVLSMALSGDVVLPSQPQPGDELVLLDQTNSALLWVDPTNSRPSRQLCVGDFDPNQHDLVGLSPNKADVTRYEKNPHPNDGPTANDQGNDLLIIDPSVPSVLGHIDLSGYAVQAGASTILARPDRALLADG